jgi:hypothetical protein
MKCPHCGDVVRCGGCGGRVLSSQARWWRRTREACDLRTVPGQAHVAGSAARPRALPRLSYCASGAEPRSVREARAQRPPRKGGRVTTTREHVKVSPAERRAIDRERSNAFWQKKRARGQCTATGCTKDADINPRTGQAYWRCRDCRRSS